MAAIIHLCSSGRSCGSGSRKSPEHIAIKKITWH